MINRGDCVIHGNHQRTTHACLHIDQVVAFLSVIPESVLLEDTNQTLEVDRSECGHAVYLMLIVRRSIDTNSGARQLSPSCW